MGAKSLVYYAALIPEGLAALTATGAASGMLLGESVALADAPRTVCATCECALSEGGAVEIDIVGTGARRTYNVRVADGGQQHLARRPERTPTSPGAPAAITTPGRRGRRRAHAGLRHERRAHDPPLREPRADRRLPRGPPAGRGLKLPAHAQRPCVALPAGPTPAPACRAGRAAVQSNALVRDVRFERAPGSNAGCAPHGCDRVIVDLGAIPAYSLSTSAGRPAPPPELRATGAARDVPRAHARRERIIRRRASRSITASLRTTSQSGSVTMPRARSRGRRAQGFPVSVEGGLLVWSFPVPKPVLQRSPIVQLHIDGRAVGSDRGAVRHVVTVAREPEIKDLPRIETSIHDDDPARSRPAGGGAAGLHSSSAGGNSNVLAQQAHYTGRRVNIDLKDADIHNVLRLLADTGHVNIVTADDVSGTVTIRMVNVPWDQVLDVVLQAKGLGMVRQGNLIRVAKLDQLQKERELRLAQQKQEYELTPLETRLIPISYAQADELQQRAKELLSPRGSIAVDERTNMLIARDIGANLNYIEQLVRSLDTQTAQVLIEARIVEATSNYQRDVGIQWGGDTTFSAATGNPTGVAFPSSVGVAGGNYDNNTPTAGLSPFTRTVSTPNFAVNLPAAVGTGAGGALGVTLGSIDNTLNLALRLSALESSGLVRIVSAPKVMVLNNREARINQGTLIPFAQVSALGVQTTFQEAKLQLLVKPHVTADGGVSMHVKLNRDEPDFTQTSPRGDPTILKREAETDLLVMDGHTAVIGGIYTRNTGRNLDQIPFFGDIPILGVLFQRRRAADARGELLIFITPHIVNRSESLGR